MKRISFFKKAFVTVCLIASVFMVLSLPVFNIDEIVISGNNILTERHILSVISENRGNNFFRFNSTAARRELMMNPYVADVQFERHFPDKLTVTVKERTVSGYVQYINGEYIYIDEEGTVLEVAPGFTKQLPVVVGLDFASFSLGQPILPGNSSTFDIIVELQYLFMKYGLEHDVVRVDLSNEDNIRLFMYNIIIEFGSIENADEKIRILIVTLYSLPDYETVNGFLYLNTAIKDEVARFRRLT